MGASRGSHVAARAGRSVVAATDAAAVTNATNTAVVRRRRTRMPVPAIGRRLRGAGGRPGRGRPAWSCRGFSGRRAYARPMVGTAQRDTRASAPSVDASPSSSRASASVAIVGVTLVPLVVAFVALFTGKRGRITPWGDTALLELSVRDVGSHVLLLGPYSRYHWHHPGPLLFDWLAVPYRLLGSNARALNQGSLLTAAIAIGVVAWVVHRRGGTALVAWSMVVAGLLIWAVGPDVVRSPWNPWITVLPLLAVIALAWNATAGGSFVVQSHVGYAAVTLAVLGGAGVIVLVTAVRRRIAWKPVIVAGLVSVGVLLVLWAPPVYQQVR